ncbi:MAG: 50S ribosomal protein L21 [Candidatus Paceibacterota bacterium]
MPTTKAQKKTSPKVAESAKEFAVIATGGKQYTVSAGDSITIEKMSDEHKVGDTVVFEKVLLVDNGTDTTIGTPYISSAKVTGKISEIGRLAKVIVIHYKQKSKYFKKNGHRQPFVKVMIEKIG